MKLRTYNCFSGHTPAPLIFYPDELQKPGRVIQKGVRVSKTFRLRIYFRAGDTIPNQSVKAG